MPQPLIIGNWKMNGSRSSVAKLSQNLIAELDGIGTQVVICPPAVFVADVADYLKNEALKKGLSTPGYVQLGAQNICEFGDGAYTGEVSGSMLREFDCSYAIIGHSERRQGYHESNEQVADKLIAAQQAGIQPVVCIGETEAERERGETMQVLHRQLAAIIDKAGVEALGLAVIAYEPIWAIGTGKVATVEQAQQALAEVRSLLGVAGVNTQLLYGGSVTISNAAQLFEQQDINGALVGGASLDADHFVKICKMAGLN